MTQADELEERDQTRINSLIAFLIPKIVATYNSGYICHCETIHFSTETQSKTHTLSEKKNTLKIRLIHVLRPEQDGKLSAPEHGEILAKENDSEYGHSEEINQEEHVYFLSFHFIAFTQH